MNIIFDFDGTLVDSKEQFIDIYNSMAVKKNRPYMTKEVFNKLSEMSMFEKLRLFNISLLEISKIYHEMEKRNFENVDKLKLFDGIKELIVRLSQTNKLYILSTNSKRIIKKVLENNGILDRFENIYTNKNLFGKAMSLRMIIRTNFLDTSKVVYVGDEERDIIASKKVKIPVISVAWGFDSLELLGTVKPEFIAKTTENLIEYIERIITNEIF